MGIGSIFYLVFLLTVKKPETAVRIKTRDKQKKMNAITLLKNRNIASLCGNYIFNSFSVYFTSQLILFLSMTDSVKYSTATRGFIATAGSVGLPKK